MKTTRQTAQELLLSALLLGMVTLPGLAQQTAKDKGEVTIKIIERNGDQVRETTRTYRLDSNDDRDKIAMKLVDSLKAAHPNERKRQVTIIIDEGEGNRIRQRPGSSDVYARRPYSVPQWEYDIRTGVDSVAGKVDRFFRYDFEPGLNRVFDNWSRTYNGAMKPSTIRSLDVFPNNPDKDQLNIRFTAPAKGDIDIVVTTAKGKEVSRRTINDFSGEYVGQINLGKKVTPGVYFVSVTQNEDGAVKRVVVE
ncbi:MAG: T9SS type A sorting domain-containing protein [Rudanella sp.]|nr:T9SS type A sorting domain-containing protein [Rudanella sp.]